MMACDSGPRQPRRMGGFSLTVGPSTDEPAVAAVMNGFRIFLRRIAPDLEHLRTDSIC